MRAAHVQDRFDSFRAARGDGLLVPLMPGSTRRPSPGASMTITAINARNQFRGTIREIIEGPVVSEVDVQTPQGLIVTSVITTRSVKELGLQVGHEVVALVKSTEVAIATL
jgi:molybdopterin-binding protein